MVAFRTVCRKLAKKGPKEAAYIRRSARSNDVSNDCPEIPPVFDSLKDRTKSSLETRFFSLFGQSALERRKTGKHLVMHSLPGLFRIYGVVCTCNGAAGEG